MAEAFAVVGGAASLVQLADASIRVCLCLFTFFSTLNNVQPEFHHHVLVIKDVHDSIQILRKTINSQSLTEAERKAFSSQLDTITQELSNLEKTTTGKDPTKLRAKIAWILKSAETDRALQRLENHKTSLMLLLQTFNLGQSERILSSQTLAQAHMQSLVQQQKRDGAAMRSDVGKAIREIDNRITALDTVFALYQQHFKDAFSFMSREIRVSEEHVGNIVRNELRRQLRPLVEEILTKSEIQNSAMLEHFRVLIDDAATEILKCIASEGDRKEQLTTRDTNSTPSQHHSANAEQHPQHSMMARPATQEHTNSLDTDPASLARASRTWCSTTKHSYQANIPYIGSFRVEYRTHEERKGRFCTFRIDFWPSTIFLLRRSISLKYSTRPDIQGYIALCPSLAVRPIISQKDPIWGFISNDDVDAVLKCFLDGENGPFDQDNYGGSLLMHAAYSRSYRTTQLLLDQGADPTQTTSSGQDSLNALLTREIATTFIIPPCYDRRFVSMAKHFESFCTTFHSMVALGCDLEDCEFTICDHHLDPKFSKLPFDCRKRDRQENDPKEAVSESDSISMIHGSSTQSQCEDTDDEAQEDYLGSIRRLAGFLNLQGFDLLHNSGNSDV